MDDGFLTLASWTKKILIEENHTIPQLSHMLYIIVKYHKVYYLIRHSLINHMISSFQKVGLSASSTPENRQLAIDSTEVILRWEAQRVREMQLCQSEKSELSNEQAVEAQSLEALLLKHPDMHKPFDKNVADSILNFFIRNACPMSEAPSGQQQQTECAAKRCLVLFQIAISHEIWTNAEIKFDYLDKILQSVEATAGSSSPPPFYPRY